ncbi:MAG: 4-hydroxythreonine-4-phosphate dehydrogenase PdxA [Hyphomicrobiales bacterium]|nr:4-hydroxythreonine-4-phosphate dehydrogenase PdxA [Hyphomicrobiales bacterium]
MNDRRPIAVTVGDPAGIGPEIVVRLLSDGTPHPAVAIGDIAALRRAASLLGRKVDVVSVGWDGPFERKAGEIPVIATSDLADVAWGRIDARCGRAAHDAIVAAARAAIDGRARAVVTAPIHKEALAAAGIAFPGHTELLAAEAGGVNVAMMLANDELRVLLVSIHVSLRDAVALVTEDNVLRAIGFADRACRQLGVAHPRVAVAGLNPHAGENGLMGDEDQQQIAPAVNAARAAGIEATGPWSPDTIFMRARRGEFDIVVAQYHDQGIIPIKYMGLDKGVNVTIGLPFVRTSVDHGTAFDIAGKGIADASSLRAAFDMAARMAPI